MLTALMAVGQAGVVVVRPPARSGFLPVSVRPVGVWRLARPVDAQAVAIALVAPGGSRLTLSGEGSNDYPRLPPAPKVVTFGATTWYVGTTVKGTTVVLTAVSPRRPSGLFQASGTVQGGLAGRPYLDALMTLKTFRAL